MSAITTLIIIIASMTTVLGGITLIAHMYNLNQIKNKTVGNGQHGTARWATKAEIIKTYDHVPYTPSKWREQARNGSIPTMSVFKKGNLFKKHKPQILEEPLPQGIVAYFTEERLNEVVKSYASSTIEKYYYWQKNPSKPYEGEILYPYIEEKIVIGSLIEISNSVKCAIDGNIYDDNVITNEGIYTITIIDDFGNTNDYCGIVVGQAPQICYSLGSQESNDVDYNREYLFNRSVTVSITDAFDTMAMYRVYNDKNELIAVKNIDEEHTVDVCGKYYVIAVNHFGESKKFEFELSMCSPTVEFHDSAELNTLEIIISDSEDLFSQVKTVSIEKSTDGGITWTKIVEDDFGNTISLKRPTYYFKYNGIYKVSISDNFRNGVDIVSHEKDYKQPIPKGELKGVVNGGFTNTPVYFSWNDNSTVSVFLNGENINYRSGVALESDGFYTITQTNDNGDEIIYQFTIDTITPSLVIEGAENGKKVNNSVHIYAEDGITMFCHHNNKIIEFEKECFACEDGFYEIYAYDKSSNCAYFTFEIDKTVSYTIDTFDGGIANTVTICTLENINITMLKDGKPYSYVDGTQITVPGNYHATLIDALGNKSEVSFCVVEKFYKTFSYSIEEFRSLNEVIINGEKHEDLKCIVLDKAGEYEISFLVGDVCYSVNIIVNHFNFRYVILTLSIIVLFACAIVAIIIIRKK